MKCWKAICKKDINNNNAIGFASTCCRILSPKLVGCLHRRAMWTTTVIGFRLSIFAEIHLAFCYPVAKQKLRWNSYLRRCKSAFWLCNSGLDFDTDGARDLAIFPGYFLLSPLGFFAINYYEFPLRCNWAFHKELIGLRSALQLGETHVNNSICSVEKQHEEKRLLRWNMWGTDSSLLLMLKHYKVGRSLNALWRLCVYTTAGFHY